MSHLDAVNSRQLKILIRFAINGVLPNHGELFHDYFSFRIVKNINMFGNYLTNYRKVWQNMTNAWVQMDWITIFISEETATKFHIKHLKKYHIDFSVKMYSVSNIFFKISKLKSTSYKGKCIPYILWCTTMF